MTGVVGAHERGCVLEEPRRSGTVGLDLHATGGRAETLRAGAVGGVRGAPDLAGTPLEARVVRTAGERRQRGPELDRTVQPDDTSQRRAHRTRTDAVKEAVNDAPGRTVGWSPEISASVGAVIGSRQQKPRPAGANTWRNG